MMISIIRYHDMLRANNQIFVFVNFCLCNKVTKKTCTLYAVKKISKKFVYFEKTVFVQIFYVYAFLRNFRTVLHDWQNA